jgi:hypothetical protein
MAATELVGGEPVYHFMQWLRLAGPFGAALRPFTNARPRLLHANEDVRLADSGYLLPVLDTMPMGFGTALTTSEDRILFESEGNIIFELQWADIRSYVIGPGAIFPEDEPRRFVQMRTGPKHFSYLLWVRPKNEEDWLTELVAHQVTEDTGPGGSPSTT